MKYPKLIRCGIDDLLKFFFQVTCKLINSSVRNWVKKKKWCTFQLIRTLPRCMLCLSTKNCWGPRSGRYSNDGPAATVTIRPRVCPIYCFGLCQKHPKTVFYSTSQQQKALLQYLANNVGCFHGSLNVPIEHHPTIRYIYGL